MSPVNFRTKQSFTLSRMLRLRSSAASWSTSRITGLLIFAAIAIILSVPDSFAPKAKTRPTFSPSHGSVCGGRDARGGSARRRALDRLLLGHGTRRDRPSYYTPYTPAHDRGH